MIRIEPLTAELLKRFNGESPEWSVRGYAWIDDDEVFAILCVSQFTEKPILLFDSTRDLNSFRLKREVVVKGWKLIKKLFSGEVYSIVDKDKPTAEQLHKHLGFEPIDDELYVYRGA